MDLEKHLRSILQQNGPITFDPLKRAFVTGKNGRAMYGVAAWIQRHTRATKRRKKQNDTSPYSRPRRFVGRYQGSMVDTHFTALSSGCLVPVDQHRRRDSFRWKRGQEPEERQRLASWMSRHVRIPPTTNAEQQAKRVHPLAWHAVKKLYSLGMVPLAGRVCVGHGKFGTATDGVWFHRGQRCVVLVELKKYVTWDTTDAGVIPDALEDVKEDAHKHQLQMAMTAWLLWNRIQESDASLTPALRMKALLVVVDERSTKIQWMRPWSRSLASRLLKGGGTKESPREIV